MVRTILHTRGAGGRRCLLSLLLLLVLLLGVERAEGQRYSGRVRDAETTRALSGVEILTERGYRLAWTDGQGQFTFDYGADSLRVVLFADGYRQGHVILRLGQGGEFTLSPLGKELQEVTVIGHGATRGNSTFVYTSADVRGMATLAGEVDVLRYPQLLPGVSQGMEGGLGFYVRGAGSGNNRTELDGVPIPAPTHLFGLFSVFHPDIVGQSTFQMGGITASSGDFTSSLLQIRSRRPSAGRPRGSFALSPLMVGGALEGRLIGDRLSYQVAGRSSLLRPEYLLLKALLGKEAITGDFDAQVQDLYAKVHWALSAQHSAEVLLFGSNDYLGYLSEEDQGVDRNKISFGWRNRALKVGWTYTPREQLRLETSVYYAGYSTRQGQVGQDGIRRGLVVGSEKGEWALRSHLTTQVRELDLGTGLDLRQQTFRPMMQSLAVDGARGADWSPTFTTTLASLYMEGRYRNPNYSVQAGLRYNLFRDPGRQISHHLDARLKYEFVLTPTLSLEATYDHLTQYQHTLEGLPVGWALDLVIPASHRFRPEHSDQGYLGGVWSTPGLYITLGGYYRRLTGLTAYRSWLNHFTRHNVSWEEDVLTGRGHSYGLELWVEKRQGRLTGSLSYTLSRTRRTFPELNGGRSYPFSFDRTHILNVQTRYEVCRTARREQHLSLAGYLTSGGTMTIPLASYQAEGLPYWETQESGIFVPSEQDYHATTRTQMSSLNAYRLPPYLRFDLSYSFLWRRRRVSHELTIGIYNILNRKNPYLIYYERNSWRQLSILSLVPSVRWELRF